MLQNGETKQLPVERWKQFGDKKKNKGIMEKQTFNQLILGILVVKSKYWKVDFFLENISNGIARAKTNIRFVTSNPEYACWIFRKIENVEKSVLLV